MHNLHTTCALPEITIIRLYSPLFKRSPLKEKVFMARRNGQEKMNSLRKCLPQTFQRQMFRRSCRISGFCNGTSSRTSTSNLEPLGAAWSYSPAVPVAWTGTGSPNFRWKVKSAHREMCFRPKLQDFQSAQLSVRMARKGLANSLAWPTLKRSASSPKVLRPIFKAQFGFHFI